MMRFGSSIFFLLALSSFTQIASSQTTELDIKSRLKGKPLYLRGCWPDDNLGFDSVGKLVKGAAGATTFTLSGFEFQRVQVEPDKIILEGRRIGLELSDKKQKRVALNIGKINNPKDEDMLIEIAASPSGDYSQALDAIFVVGLVDLVPSLPPYWKTYAAKNLVPVDANPASQASTSPNPAQATNNTPKRIGGAIKPPTLLHAAEPEFNSSARGLAYSGKVLINFWLHPDGQVSHLSLVRAVGLGLDERALAALQKYKFSPATMNGTPLLVELNVEVNFQIY
jgi:TonB family protein